MVVFLCGIILIVDSLLLLAYGDSVWRGTLIPAWTGWPGLFLGVLLIIVYFRFLRGVKEKPRTYTDEDAQKAEAEMDAMYVRDHGRLPEKPGKAKGDN